MRTRNVVILVVAVSIISILFTYLVVSAITTNERRMRGEEVTLKKETSPVSQSSLTSAQPAAKNKDQIIALFDVGKDARRAKAIEAFKKVMRDIPPYIGTGTKGYPFALQGQYEKAAQISESEIKDNPDVVGPRYTLAWIYARTGRYDNALAVCNDALQRGSSFNSVRYLIGWVFAKQGKYDEALKTCDDALRNDPYSAVLYYAKGRIQDLSGHDDEAIENYSKAISFKSDFLEAYVFEGLLYTKLGRYDDAVAAQKQAIKSNMYSPMGYLGLGLVYDEMGNYQLALTQFTNAVTFGSMGENSYSTKQPLTQSIGIDDSVIYTRIGVLNDRLGSYQDALTAFNNAVAARQDYPDAYRGLVLTYLLLGDKESALKSYGTLKALDADMANSLADIVGANK